MVIGYIKINDKVSQIFIDKTDDYIRSAVQKLKETFNENGLSVNIDWNNQYTDKTEHQLLEFLGY